MNPTLIYSHQRIKKGRGETEKERVKDRVKDRERQRKTEKDRERQRRTEKDRESQRKTEIRQRIVLCCFVKEPEFQTQQFTFIM